MGFRMWINFFNTFGYSGAQDQKEDGKVNQGGGAEVKIVKR